MFFFNGFKLDADLVLDKKSIGKFLLVCLLSNQVLSKEHGCIWYGECNIDQSKHKQNCPYNGPAKELTNTTSINIFKKWCPHMVPASGPLNLCCDDAQLSTLDFNIKMAANFLARCSSCLYNFLSYVCEVSCAPDHSRFINVTETSVTKTEKTIITSIEVYVSEDYLWRTYNSCIDVSVPSTGQLALDIMCGSWGASRCSPYKWFKYLFYPNMNSYVPFKIAFVPVSSVQQLPDGFSLLDPKTSSCDVPVTGLVPACSCMDCEASCPAAPPVPPPAPSCQLVGQPCLRVVMTLIFIVTSLMFLFVTSCQQKLKVLFNDSELVQHTSTDGRNAVGCRLATDDRCSSNIHDDETSPLQSKCSSPASNFDRNNTVSNMNINNQPSVFEKLGAELDKLLQESFERLGQSCALHPWRTLGIGVCVVMVLGHGIFYLRLTTDPVELWASPNSRSRQEKTYFDTNFVPFYRTEQVIIHAVGLDNSCHINQVHHGS